MAILITGTAGFIGFHTAKRLLEEGEIVIGVDNFNEYYDINLKETRNKILEGFANFKMYRIDLADYSELAKIFEENKIERVIHLGAQGGVRYSLSNPGLYERSNITGTLHIFELSRRYSVKNIIYASSSSVYGGNTKIPFSEDDPVDKPISFYAMTKRVNELLAYTYHHLYGMKMTGLRFFTVYGEWGRPDMAMWKFTKNILEGKEIEVYNFGNMKRDFTYVADIVEGILLALRKEFDHEIINLGNNNPVALNYFIELIEKATGKQANKKMMEMQSGDVPVTCADISKAKRLLGWEPKTSIEEGIKRFVEWFKQEN